MITVVSGKLGSGKSYDCVRMIRDHLASGGCVRTNISLDAAQISQAVGRHVSSLQIGKLAHDADPTTIPTGDRRGRGTRRTLVVLDEALNWFQSEGTADRKDLKKQQWGEWLRQSDKLGQDVYFIAQNFERAAKWIRELAQISIEVFPMKDIRILMFLPLGTLCPFFRRVYCVRRRDVRSGIVCGTAFHRYSPKVWKLYDTSETFGFQGAASAYDALRLWPPYRKPTWALWFAVIFPLLGALAVAFLR